jgi:general secretion pathway protein G
MPIHRHDPKVFFPWERRRGLGSVLRRARGRRVLLAASVVAAFFFVYAREQRARDVRATRATITTASRALSAFRADHDERCPPSLSDLVAGGYLHEVPRDAWGHPLRVACPGKSRNRAFDISSDGPDGEPLGLDRVQ